MLNNFINKLPKKPYSTECLTYGIKPRKAEKALELRYIQPNGPTHLHWMAFDIDRGGAALDWYDLNAPAPNITITNPANKHAHLLYALEVPVRTAPDGLIKPLRYAAAVQSGLTKKLQADCGYSGLIIKNPCHSHWLTEVIHNDFYDLGELADYVNLPIIDIRKSAANEAFGLGRNCIVFDNLRGWSYQAIRRAGFPSFNLWLAMCVDHVEKLNSDFPEPLGYGELHQIAKSVAKWVYKNFSAKSFSVIQSARGKKGGRPSIGEPWSDLGISRRTYFRHKKSGLILPD
jgi:hypothetical protein